jgi:hypothetical protein
MAFRSYPHFVSQYAWAIVIYAIFLTAAFFPIPIHIDPINSRPTTIPWNSTSRPQVFAHISDVHVRADSESTKSAFARALEHSLSLHCNPIIVTGDLADCWKGSLPEIGFGDQLEADWQAYDEVLAAAGSFAYIDTAGNHDEYGVPAMNSSVHYVLRYGRSMNDTQTIDSYWASTIRIGDVDFVLLNPFVYPRPHARIGFWAQLSTEALDRIENELRRPVSAHRVILCHYPVRLWIPAKSSSGRTFSEIIMGSRATFVLSGHIHYRTAALQHFSGVVEFVGADLIWHHAFGIVSLDNRRMVYHSVALESGARAILTHPVPKRQLTTSTEFDETTTEIRVLSFVNETLQINVSGAVSGTLQRDGSVYRMWMNLSRGEHHLRFFGDWEHEVDFVVGPTAALPDEVAYGYNQIVLVLEVFVGVIWLFELAIAFPFAAAPQLFVKTDKWIRGESEEPHWVAATVLGFMVMRTRIQQLPWAIRLLLFVLVVWPVALPMALTRTGDLTGFIFIYGYYLGNKVTYDPWGPLYAAFLLGVVVLPFLNAAASLSLADWGKVMILDRLVGVAGLVAAIGGALALLMQAVDVILMLISPPFVLLPLATAVALVFWKIRQRKKLDPPDDLTAPLWETADHEL